MNLINNSSTPTLCLNMIVKNESKIITRLFDSVLPIIDSYCICDTGSTDDTINIIQQYFAAKNIPGTVVVEPFKDFCHNRNFALKAAQGISDFVLLMDADMVLDIKDFNKNELLEADSYHIFQGNDSFFYQNMRIVKNNGLYSYAGVTHEYINTPSGNKTITFTKNKLFIKDIGDGGSKSNKFQRDIQLLTDGIKEEPNNVRYYFYLANSYHDSGKNEEAIEIYKQRIKLGGWNEEVWYSYYRIGCCYKNIGDISNAICYWMEGYDFLPDRLEGLCEIITHYRVISKHKLALIFYKLALEILKKNNSNDYLLFLHNDVYTYKIYYEYTIIASWLGITNINDEVVKVLNNCDDYNINTNTLNNMKYYKDVLNSLNVINLDSKTDLFVNGENTTFNSTSSCLIQNETKNGYLLNTRYVNYYITEQGYYINCDKYIVTVNKYAELDKELKINKEHLFELNFVDKRYVGIEDVRIFNDITTNKLLFIGTGFHNNNQIGIVTGDYNVNNNILVSNEITSGFSNSDCEKNWIFVDYKNETHIIYKWKPLQICKLNKSDNKIQIVETKEMPKIFSHVRGSSSGFKYNKIITTTVEDFLFKIAITELWFVVHIVSYEQPRHYYHMIVVFDETMKLLRYSAPFKFQGEPIEYCLSLVVEDERVLINYSTWDRSTRIGIYDKKYIDSITKYK